MKSTNGGRRRASASQSAPPSQIESNGKPDYTPAVLDFLRDTHGKIRVDEKMDYYYDRVSAISLHFLLQSELPQKDVLWAWYSHFEREQSVSIYQTIGPQQDEALLRILSCCEFDWDYQAVCDSGLVFLPQHRRDVFVAMEDIVMQRIEVYETMDDRQLEEALRPNGTWSDEHLRRMIRKIQTRQIGAAQRQQIYNLFDSDYLRATARVMIQKFSKDTFWKQPPNELEDVEARLMVFARTMASNARRLGVFVSRADFEDVPQGRTRHRRSGADNGSRVRDVPGRTAELHHSYFEVLGLGVEASLADVKNSYRQKVKETHPDQGGTVQGFLKLQEAYEVLLTEVF